MVLISQDFFSDEPVRRKFICLHRIFCYLCINEVARIFVLLFVEPKVALDLPSR
jgi:hypothetical protein